MQYSSPLARQERKTLHSLFGILCYHMSKIRSSAESTSVLPYEAHGDAIPKTAVLEINKLATV